MEIIWNGQACFKIKGKSASLIIDPYSPEFTGLKLPKDLSCDIALSTHAHEDHSNTSALTGQVLTITGPGEYEVKGVSITGVQVYHDKKEGSERGKNTIYNILVDGLNVVHLGDLGHILSESQIEEIGQTDILLIPVGGVFTINAKEAAEVVTQLEPKIVIPMHYKIEGLKFDLEAVDVFLKELGVESPAPLPKLSITKDKLPDEMQVIVLDK